MGPFEIGFDCLKSLTVLGQFDTVSSVFVQDHAVVPVKWFETEQV